MSEYLEPHSISRLIGAPPGYVGFDEPGELTEKIRRRPYSVILFDEIEKAHPKVHNLLLQILEEGELTDSKGRKISFKNSLIVMTSNIGTSKYSEAAKIGFSTNGKKQKSVSTLESRYQIIKEKTLKELKNRLKPELLNRLDTIVVFKPLGKEALAKIAELRIKELKNRLAEKGISANFDAKVCRIISDKASRLNEGARPVRRLIEELIENQLAEMIIEGNITNSKRAIVNVKNGKIVIG